MNFLHTRYVKLRIFLSDDNQADVIEVLKSASRYLDDLLNIENLYFEGLLNQKRAYINLNQLTKPPFWIFIYLFLMIKFSRQCMISATILILIQ